LSVSSCPPARGFVERWALALIVSLFLLPVGVAIVVPIVWSAVLLWYVTLPVIAVGLLVVVWVLGGLRGLFAWAALALAVAALAVVVALLLAGAGSGSEGAGVG
jgi:hypothetical protein